MHSHRFPTTPAEAGIQLWKARRQRTNLFATCLTQRENQSWVPASAGTTQLKVVQVEQTLFVIPEKALAFIRDPDRGRLTESRLGPGYFRFAKIPG